MDLDSPSNKARRSSTMGGASSNFNMPPSCLIKILSDLRNTNDMKSIVNKQVNEKLKHGLFLNGVDTEEVDAALENLYEDEERAANKRTVAAAAASVRYDWSTTKPVTNASHLPPLKSTLSTSATSSTNFRSIQTPGDLSMEDTVEVESVASDAKTLSIPSTQASKYFGVLARNEFFDQYRTMNRQISILGKSELQQQQQQQHHINDSDAMSRSSASSWKTTTRLSPIHSIINNTNDSNRQDLDNQSVDPQSQSSSLELAAWTSEHLDLLETIDQEILNPRSALNSRQRMQRAQLSQSTAQNRDRGGGGENLDDDYDEKGLDGLMSTSMDCDDNGSLPSLTLAMSPLNSFGKKKKSTLVKKGGRSGQLTQSASSTSLQSSQFNNSFPSSASTSLSFSSSMSSLASSSSSFKSVSAVEERLQSLGLSQLTSYNKNNSNNNSVNNQHQDDSSSSSSPRTQYLASCVSGGLPPHPSVILRRHMKTGMKLAHFGIGDGNGRLLAQCINRLPCLESLDLSNNNLSDNSLRALIDSIDSMSTLLELDLSNNVKISRETIRKLISFMGSQRCFLVKLRLVAMNLDDELLHEMVTTLRNSKACNNTLEILDLSRNKIGMNSNSSNHSITQNSMTSLAEYLKDSVVTQLNLTNLKSATNITDNFYNPAIINKTAKSNSNITNNLNNANFTNNKCRLQSLILSWNSIRLHSAVTLLQAIGKNTSLLSLDVSNCNLGGLDAGGCWSTLAKALMENQTLVEVNLSNNGFSDTSCCGIFMSLVYNTSLRRLVIDGNPLGRVGTLSMIHFQLFNGFHIEVSARECNTHFGMKSSDKDANDNDNGNVMANKGWEFQTHTLDMKNAQQKSLFTYLMLISTLHATVETGRLTMLSNKGKKSFQETSLVVCKHEKCRENEEKVCELQALIERLENENELRAIFESYANSTNQNDTINSNNDNNASIITDNSNPTLSTQSEVRISSRTALLNLILDLGIYENSNFTSVKLRQLVLTLDENSDTPAIQGGSVPWSTFHAMIRSVLIDLKTVLFSLQNTFFVALKNDPAVKYSPITGTVGIKLIETFTRKAKFHVLHEIELKHLIDLCKTINRVDLLVEGIKYSKLRFNEALRLFQVLHHLLHGNVSQSLTCLLPTVISINDCQQLIKHVTRDDFNQVTKIGYNLGSLFGPLTGSFQKYFTLNLSCDNDRLCLSKLFENALFECNVRKVNPVNVLSTSLPTNVSSCTSPLFSFTSIYSSATNFWFSDVLNNPIPQFRNIVYNGRPLPTSSIKSIDLSFMQSLPAFGRLEFDYVSMVNPQHMKQVSMEADYLRSTTSTNNTYNAAIASNSVINGIGGVSIGIELSDSQIVSMVLSLGLIPWNSNNNYNNDDCREYLIDLLRRWKVVVTKQLLRINTSTATTSSPPSPIDSSFHCVADIHQAITLRKLCNRFVKRLQERRQFVRECRNRDKVMKTIEGKIHGRRVVIEAENNMDDKDHETVDLEEAENDEDVDGDGEEHGEDENEQNEDTEDDDNNTNGNSNAEDNGNEERQEGDDNEDKDKEKSDENNEDGEQQQDQVEPHQDHGDDHDDVDSLEALDSMEEKVMMEIEDFEEFSLWLEDKVGSWASSEHHDQPHLHHRDSSRHHFDALNAYLLLLHKVDSQVSPSIIARKTLQILEYCLNPFTISVTQAIFLLMLLRSQKSRGHLSTNAMSTHHGHSACPSPTNNNSGASSNFLNISHGNNNNMISQEHIFGDLVVEAVVSVLIPKIWDRHNIPVLLSQLNVFEYAAVMSRIGPWQLLNPLLTENNAFSLNLKVPEERNMAKVMLFLYEFGKNCHNVSNAVPSSSQSTRGNKDKNVKLDIRAAFQSDSRADLVIDNGTVFDKSWLSDKTMPTSGLVSFEMPALPYNADAMLIRRVLLRFSNIDEKTMLADIASIADSSANVSSKEAQRASEFIKTWKSFDNKASDIQSLFEKLSEYISPTSKGKVKPKA